MMKTRFLGALALTFALAVPAQGQIIGEPADANGNCFPFGCTHNASPTRYQQVYAASNFASPFTINSLSFFLHPQGTGQLNSGTFEFYLSTTSAAVDGLSSTMDDNLGADVALFGSFVLSGGAPSVLTFASGTGFSYDPGLGNLLLDIRISGFSEGSSAFLARTGGGHGLFSRMHDFGSGDDGYGLLTGFNGAALQTSEPGALLLLATGILGLAMLGRRREIESV